MAEELGIGLQNLLHGCESRSRLQGGQMAELVYAADLKSVADKAWGFESLSAHHSQIT